MRKHITDIINQDYKLWNKGDLIFITSGTGTGKTYFIKSELNTYCVEHKKNILYLTNRDNLKEQVLNDISTINNKITVMNYQKVEMFILNNISFDNYDYVVMDEVHYFFTDSAFNCKTNLFFKRMLRDKDICKILMTATPTIIKNYFKQNKVIINYNYELPTDYSYLKQIIAFNTYESIDSIIESIPDNEQIIFFSNIKRAYDISKKYNGAFICSKHNKDNYYDKYIKETENELELKNIIENGTFNNHLLCCTTALDNGINIKENTPVKHIIIDILDRDTFIQCLGRKRIAEGEKINLYFYAWNDNKKINGFKSRIANSLERADYLLEHGQKEYVFKKFKNEHFTDTRIIDDIIDSEGHIQKVVNECIYAKYHTDLVMYNSFLDKKYKNNLKNIIAINLNINKEDIIDMEVITKIYTLEEALESAVGKKLFKDGQKELIDFIDLKANGKKLKSYETFNAYFKEKKIPYLIVSKRDNIRNSETYGKRYWEIINNIVI